MPVAAAQVPGTAGGAAAMTAFKSEYKRALTLDRFMVSEWAAGTAGAAAVAAAPHVYADEDGHWVYDDRVIDFQTCQEFLAAEEASLAPRLGRGCPLS